MNNTSAMFAGCRMTVTAPSRQWLTREGRIDFAVHEACWAALERLGFTVSLLPTTGLETGRFAGSDAERARDLMAAACDKTADVMMAMRGGYGAARLLSLLDFDRLRQSDVPAVGFSDFTAINLALLAKTGRPSWQGPMGRDFIAGDPYTLSHFQAVTGHAPWAVDWSLERASGALEVQGTLWGGNLAVIMSLVGTPYMPQVSDGILFIEDIGESAYRIERMLLQLLQSGILSRQKALLVGSMSGADRPVAWDGDFCLADALDYIARESGVPVITGLPFGHTPRKASLPVGRRVSLGVDGVSAQLRPQGDWL